jgi:NADH-quinone oxidoreductase subunit N
LIGLVVGSAAGKSALLFYLLAYVLTNLGAFGLLAAIGTRGRGNDTLDDLTGLGTDQPRAAALLTILLLSLGGFPPTAGFIGKWYIFSAAVQDGYYGLAIVGVLTSVVSVFYYLRIVVRMYMTPKPVGAVSLPIVPTTAMMALAVTVAGVLLLGILPARVVELAAQSISTIF